MNLGEKMVWACIFSKEYDKVMNVNDVPSKKDLGASNMDEWNDKWEELLLDKLSVRCEDACHAVLRLRQIEPSVKDGYGEDSYVYKMLYEMIYGS